MNNPVKIKALFDRNLISEAGDSIRYLLVKLDTPSSGAKTGIETSPLNLALVIDSSRSMMGERLNCAVRAAAEIIEGLSEHDFISIVSFSNDALVHADGISCDDWGKRYALECLSRISHRAGTNLSAGWFKGAECVGAIMSRQPNCKNHIVILSDGHANQGTLEPAALLHHAGELQIRGVTASAVGIGEGYSTAQLYAIAQYGGGRIHQATHPPEIVEVVTGELEELRQRVIENLVVSISLPENVTVKSLNIIPCELEEESVRCFFGGMSSGASRAAVFRLGTTPGERDQEIILTVTATWRSSGRAEILSSEPVRARLTFVSPRKNADQEVDQATGLFIASLWQSWIVWQATNLNRQKDYARLEKMLVRETKYFRRFCQSVPGANHLLAELWAISRIAQQDWDELSRKEIQTSTYTSFYNLKDTRQKSRKWQELTGEIQTK